MYEEISLFSFPTVSKVSRKIMYKIYDLSLRLKLKFHGKITSWLNHNYQAEYVGIF